MENDDNLMSKIILSDDMTFLLSGKVNRHSESIWWGENPHTILEVERYSSTINVLCSILLLHKILN